MQKSEEVVNNSDLNTIVNRTDSALKDVVVDFVGNVKNPENDEVTVEHIIEVFADQFPEFLMVLAEENWINGYTQALSDVEYVKDVRKPKLEESEADNDTR